MSPSKAEPATFAPLLSMSVNNSVLLIEQRLLPHEFKIIAMRDFQETAPAINDMIVRGAGAIGATAAYGLAQGARAFRGQRPGGIFQARRDRFMKLCRRAAHCCRSSERDE